MRIKMQEKDGKLYVIVSIPTYNQSGKRMKVVLRDVEKLLREKKVKYGKCLKSLKITNRRDDRCSGTFIFELVKLKPKAKTKSPPRRTRAKSVSKNKKSNLNLDIK